jgi:predicted nucleic acid-binding protein
MADRLLLDTNVLIDYLRGRPEAVTCLEGLARPLLLSAITVAEIVSLGNDVRLRLLRHLKVE